MIEIGDFKIEWVDQDHILVTRSYGEGTIHTAKICGGDMETFLRGIFISAEISHKSVKRVKETIDDADDDDDLF